MYLGAIPRAVMLIYTVRLPNSIQRSNDRFLSNPEDTCVYRKLKPGRSVFRDTRRSRAISLIVLPLMKCSRRIRAIVSTISIPNHLLRSKAGSATGQPIAVSYTHLRAHETRHDLVCR